MKRTKIVATIGPSSHSKSKLNQMIDLGMNVARVNFSHGNCEANGKIIKNIKELRNKLGMPIGIMADLQGPRIRTVVEKDTEIKPGENVIVSDISKKYRTPKHKIIKLDWPAIINDVRIGNEILIEDGLLKLKVIKKEKDYLTAEVTNGGTVRNHKGVNIPDAKLKVGAVTKKDEEDLHYALRQEVDFIALSFVSNAKEIQNTRNKIKKILGKNANIPQIVAKIERKEAIKNIDEIISASDVIMVARGDLGIEMDQSNVVIYQKEIISKCLKTGKPVIVATQMLNSMIENPRPTRAEVSDVSNAVIDHADAVMLSGETATGKYPVESIRVMGEIIKKTEDSPFDDLKHGFLGDSHTSISAAVAHSAHELAKDSRARAIVVASLSGFTARMIVRHRPQQAIYVMTNNKVTYNQLSLLWGTESFILRDCRTLDELIVKSISILTRKKLLRKKDKIVIVTGRPHVKREHMSLVKVEEIK